MQASVDSIQQLAKDLSDHLIAVRRELHRHPELSWEEHWTTGRLKAWLTEAGIAILPLPLETGLVAEVRGAAPGPTIAIRTDIDALPVAEETGLPFASEIPGKMHACGHDFHMSTVLGAALVLKRLERDLAGTVRFLFQPAEETMGGALKMIEAGALEGAAAVFGLHNKPDLPPGTIGVKVGPLMAAADRFTVTVKGRGGHAALPSACIDPVVAGSAIVMALQTAVSRSVSPLEPAVVTVASFQAGTGAHNVIPPEAVLRGTIRAFSPAVRSQLHAVVNRLAQEVAAGYGAEASVDHYMGPPAVTNAPAMCELMRRAAAAAGMGVVEAEPTMGGEDFAEYQQMVPGCYIWLGTGTPQQWHHPKFMVDESVIHRGSALFAICALEALRSLK